MKKRIVFTFFSIVTFLAFELFSYPSSDADSLVKIDTDKVGDNESEYQLETSKKIQDDIELEISEADQASSQQQNLMNDTTPGPSEIIEVSVGGHSSSDLIKDELFIEPSISEFSSNKVETSNPEIFNKSLIVYSFLFSSAVIVLLLITTTLLFKEVKWRKRYSKNESLVFPNAHLDVLEDLKVNFEALTQSLLEFGKSSNNLQLKNENLYQQLLESMSTFTNLIDDQKQEIRRLKEGYDFSIKRNSITSLVDLKILIIDIYKKELSEETADTLRKVNNYISADLEELDVDELTFDQGMPVRSIASDDYEVAEVSLTDDQHLNETVEETITSGYVYNHENGRNVIRKAKIKVYKTEDME